MEIPIVIYNNKNIKELVEKRLIKREEVNLFFLNKDTWLNNETAIETLDR